MIRESVLHLNSSDSYVRALFRGGFACSAHSSYRLRYSENLCTGNTGNHRAGALGSIRSSPACPIVAPSSGIHLSNLTLSLT